jgi:hypothetical protein
MNSFNTTVARLCRKASLAVVYIKAVFRVWITGQASLWDCITGNFKLRAASWRVTRIMVFREPPPESGEVYDSDYVELEPGLVNIESLDAKALDANTLDASVQRYIPESWDSWRVEIRCQRGSKKRRLVVRRGEPIHLWSELKTPPLYRVMSCVMDFGYLSDHTPIDIKDRFEKYIMVPYRRFYARDMFPVDDHQDMPGSVRLRLATGQKIINREFYFCDDVDMSAACLSP